MTGKRPCLFLVMAVACLLPFSELTASPPPPDTLSVLFVGNSLTYANNLPALLQGLAAAQERAPRISADMIATAGGTIADRWRDGIARTELESGRWQVLILQEQGGLLACLNEAEKRSQPDCLASTNAHTKFAELAKRHGIRLILLGTWGPDAIWQSRLSRGLRRLAKSIDADALDAGPPLRAYAAQHPEMPMYQDAMLHPTLDASLLLSALIYRRIAGSAAQAVAFEITAPLLPPLAAVRDDTLASRQAQIAGDGEPTRITAERLAPLLQHADLIPKER